MTNISREKREAQLRSTHQTANGNGGQNLTAIPGVKLREYTNSAARVAETFRDVLDGGIDWYKNATLSERVKALSVGTAVVVGGVVGANVLSQDTMTQGEQILYLAHGEDGAANPTKQFQAIENALGAYMQPKAKELFNLSLEDSKEGNEAKQTLSEGIDGLIAAGDFASSGIDFDSDLTALAHYGSNTGKALRAGLLPENFLEQPRETRMAVTAELGAKAKSLTGDLLRAQTPQANVAPKDVGR